MKSFFIFLLSAFTTQVFSQSFLVMENGIILTTDRAGYLYDYGHYTYPQKISLKGGQYFVEDGHILVTLDENGYLYRKYETIPQNIVGKGINYFISDEGFLYSIDARGMLKVSESVDYKDAKNFGGQYFTTQSKDGEDLLDLFAVTQDGAVVKNPSGTFKNKEIVSFGGNYFMTNRGAVYTVSRTGDILLSDNRRVGLIIKRGGNYFVDSSQLLYVVTESGELKMPDLPSSLRVSSILKLGSNYFIDQFGKLYTVDKDGNVSEKFMTDFDFKQTKVISL